MSSTPPKSGPTANQQTFEDLYAWLRKAPIHDLINDSCINDLAKLCKTLDKQPHANPPRIGLELHHFPQRKTDVSFFGDHTLLDNQEISYPKFARQWRKHLSENYSNDAFNRDIIVEFDHSRDGYHLMGLFQRCNPAKISLDNAIQLIKFYSDSRQQELKAGKSEYSCCQNMSTLRQNFETIGPPTYIGFLNRNSTQVKIITQIDESNKQEAIEYLENHLHKNNESGAELLSNYLKATDTTAATEARARLSLDYDIENNLFSNRYSLEYSDQEDQASATCRINSLWQSQKQNEPKNINGYDRSLNLSQRLPYGEQRPSINLLKKEIMALKLHHSKLVSTPSDTHIKDYVMLFSFIT